MATPPAVAQHLPINPPSVRADLSGSWYKPDQSGHGLMVEILDNQRVVVAWYTYDAAGSPLWLFGEGKVRGTELIAELGAFSGGRPPADWAQGDLQSEPWGTLSMSVKSCNIATLSWDSSDPDFASGELELQRLSWIQGQRCNADELYSMQLHYSLERRMPSGDEPMAVVDPVDDWLRLNIDFGIQSQAGANARVAGTLANTN